MPGKVFDFAQPRASTDYSQVKGKPIRVKKKAEKMSTNYC
jgi:hypothetical protein